MHDCFYKAIHGVLLLGFLKHAALFMVLHLLSDGHCKFTPFTWRRLCFSLHITCFPSISCGRFIFGLVYTLLYFPWHFFIIAFRICLFRCFSLQYLFAMICNNFSLFKYPEDFDYCVHFDIRSFQSFLSVFTNRLFVFTFLVVRFRLPSTVKSVL